MKINAFADTEKTKPIQTQYKPNQSQFEAKTNPNKPNTNPIKPNSKPFAGDIIPGKLLFLTVYPVNGGEGPKK